jgi:hypothetical protein
MTNHTSDLPDDISNEGLAWFFSVWSVTTLLATALSIYYCYTHTPRYLAQHGKSLDNSSSPKLSATKAQEVHTVNQVMNAYEDRTAPLIQY